MLEIVLGISLFVGIVMGLALVILAARRRLVPSGTVPITIADHATLAAPAGTTLLGALADAGILLPSACGGRGTCGLCRVEVIEGGGAVGPVESSVLSPRDAAAGARLACQVTVRRPMTIRVGDEVLGVGSWQCTVRSSRCVAPLIKEIILQMPPGEALRFRAGAFVEVTRPPGRLRFADFEIDATHRPAWDRMDLWRFESVTAEPVTRAYSLANDPRQGDVAMLDVRIAIPPPAAPPSVPPGAVSSYLFSVRPGDRVTLTGPYGHFFAGDSDREMIFIGGGVGMAPLRSHIFDQLENRRSARPIVFFYGARSRQDLFYVEQFDRLQAEHTNFRWFVALSEPQPGDDWHGLTGFIHDVAYERHLRDHPAPELAEYYLCGPPLMIAAVLKMLDDLGVEPESIYFDDFGGGR